MSMALKLPTYRLATFTDICRCSFSHLTSLADVYEIPKQWLKGRPQLLANQWQSCNGLDLLSKSVRTGVYCCSTFKEQGILCSSHPIGAAH
jgi:hypothetical protein